VSYIQLFRLRKPQGSPDGPGLGAVRAAPDRPVRYAPADDVPDEVGPTLMSTLKHVASNQEIHYSDSRTYLSDIELLEMELPDDVRVDFLSAGTRGWTGVVTHEPTGLYCLLSYGRTVPMGWRSGAVACPGL